MAGAPVRRSRSLLAGLLAAVGVFLVFPAIALAQSPGVQRPRGPASEQEATPGEAGALAGTGFEVWQVAVLGAVLIVAGLVLLRGVRVRQSEAA
ncbi:MAG: hypothetical protein ICV64_01780 [Thermoleophilia bacterium]|nr:hypothetical protein [Thermoleophilia bacterium]